MVSGRLEHLASEERKKKALRAELVVLTGLALWIVAGIAIFLAISTKGGEPVALRQRLSAVASCGRSTKKLKHY